jgi:hypothetical protein
MGPVVEICAAGSSGFTKQVRSQEPDAARAAVKQLTRAASEGVDTYAFGVKV